MSIHQIQMDRLAWKFAKIAPNQGPAKLIPPLMAPPGGPTLFADIVRIVPRVWQATNKSLPIESRGRLIKRKLEEIRSKSTALRPICVRCGDTGHRAAECRNAQLCFVCNRLGHKAAVCRTPTATVPFTPPKADAPGASRADSLPEDNPSSSPSNLHSDAPDPIDPALPMAPARRTGHPPARRGPDPALARRNPSRPPGAVAAPLPAAPPMNDMDEDLLEDPPSKGSGNSGSCQNQSDPRDGQFTDDDSDDDHNHFIQTMNAMLHQGDCSQSETKKQRTAPPNSSVSKSGKQPAQDSSDSPKNHTTRSTATSPSKSSRSSTSPNPDKGKSAAPISPVFRSDKPAGKTISPMSKTRHSTPLPPTPSFSECELYYPISGQTPPAGPGKIPHQPKARLSSSALRVRNTSKWKKPIKRPSTAAQTSYPTMVDKTVELPFQPWLIRNTILMSPNWYRILTFSYLR
ncbi:hypothetical protein FCM35_KLT20788 [Carex littledalei]|uniref:CCHC-type domain-containing protein n=1 Tax=Carex littledalei TaxID=544730 RepID=A0A833VUR2_9POAL|nr:hypothetical protein FCM35_KLT20788 [Carex littledalei]